MGWGSVACFARFCLCIPTRREWVDLRGVISLCESQPGSSFGAFPQGPMAGPWVLNLCVLTQIHEFLR